MKTKLFFLFLLAGITLDLSMAQELTISGWSVNGTEYLSVYVKGGIITKIEKTPPPSSCNQKIYLAPGLIDTQVNGYASVSFSEKGLNGDKILKITEALYKEGVTTYFPTIITGPKETTIDNLKILSKACEDPELSHVIPGFFLEGPYISPEEGYRGVHNMEWIRRPDWVEFEKFYEASGKKIIQVGLAPELPGAMPFISKAVSENIVVSLAHHNANSEEIREAVKAGASVTTHLGNGCANFIQRHNNPLWPQLANDHLTASIIADGHHLTADELTVFYKVKGPDHLMLVSDVTELAGMPPGEYDWNGKKVILTDDGALVYPEDNVLAGASFPLRKGVINMHLLAGCTLEEAFNLATQNPARVYKLVDRGLLKEGRSADLIIFSIKNDEIVVRETIVGGKIVYQIKP